MLAVINGDAPCYTGADFNMLRVIASFPLVVNFSSTSERVTNILNSDKHPLAILPTAHLVEVLGAHPESESCMEILRNSIKRAHVELEGDEAENKGPKPKKPRRSPNTD